MQWPAVITISSPTRVPEQKAPIGCSANFCPGQRPAERPKLPTRRAALLPVVVTLADFQSETTELERVFIEAGAA